ncbi:Uncharacterized protein FKW44_010976, partial [Caligus rogercresseyi]
MKSSSVIIFNSTCGIADGCKFTAQFQISADLIKFCYPCNNCGFLFNNTLYAFGDCFLLKTIQQFTHLNVCGNMDLNSN